MPAAVEPVVDGQAVAFRYDDPDRRLAGVRLWHDIGLPSDAVVFRYDEAAGAWQLRLPTPPVWRMEYLFELHGADGGTETVTDPGNPRVAPGAFGSKSVVELPGYREPSWLGVPDGALAGGAWRDVEVHLRALDADLTARVWSPATAPAPGRLLVAHDGLEYDRLAELGRFARAMIAAGRVPPFHLALLPPGDRNRWYSANPHYAAGLTQDVLPELHRVLGTDGPVVGMGPSLGGLAMLHAHRRHPDAFGGLFLQSGSFFVPEHDAHENGFSGYPQIVPFVRGVTRSGFPGSTVPVVLTCGGAEENLHNNRVMAAALRSQGYHAELHEVPDTHNYVAWRDAFDPHLTELLSGAWA